MGDAHGDRTVYAYDRSVACGQTVRDARSVARARARARGLAIATPARTMFTLSTTLAHAAVKANVAATRKSQSRRGAVKVAAQAADASSRREAMSLIAVRPDDARDAIERGIARAARRATRDATRDDARTTRGIIVERNLARGRGERRARRVEGATRATSRNEILTNDRATCDFIERRARRRSRCPSRRSRRTVTRRTFSAACRTRPVRARARRETRSFRARAASDRIDPEIRSLAGVIRTRDGSRCCMGKQ